MYKVLCLAWKLRSYHWQQILSVAFLEVTSSFHSLLRRDLPNAHIWITMVCLPVTLASKNGIPWKAAAIMVNEFKESNYQCLPLVPGWLAMEDFPLGMKWPWLYQGGDPEPQGNNLTCGFLCYSFNKHHGSCGWVEISSPRQCTEGT